MGEYSDDDNVALSEFRTAGLQDRREEPRIVPGVSLLELLMLGTLLGLLSAALVPQLLAAQEDARQSALHSTLTGIRTQISQFREHHQGRMPGQGTASATEFVAQLCGRTSVSGNVERDGRFGPYLLGTFPANPCSARADVLVIAGPLLPRHVDGTGTHGWAYSSTTGEFLPNPAVMK